MPSKSVASIPYEIWKGRKLNLKHLKIWGCPTYVKNIFGHKLSTRSDKCRFVGYPKETNGYYFYHPIEQKIFISRHTTFLKNEFIQEGGSGRNIELTEVHDLQINPEISVIRLQEDPQSEVSKDEVHPQYIPPLRRSDRVRQALLRYDFVIENDNLINIIQNDDPLTYSEAIMSRDSDRWLEAIKFEMDSMYTN